MPTSTMPTSTMPTSTMPTVKAFTRGPWKEDLHPRDRNGRFIEVGT